MEIQNKGTAQNWETEYTGGREDTVLEFLWSFPSLSMSVGVMRSDGEYFNEKYNYDKPTYNVNKAYYNTKQYNGKTTDSWLWLCIAA